MKRILLTGLSGTGKSTVIEVLAARGYQAFDLDCDAWSHWVDDLTPAELGSPVQPGRDWVWREDRLHHLLDTDEAALLFVSGCAANMRQFLPRFDHVILLYAAAEVMVARLASRTTNAYGKHPDEVARVLAQIDIIEPMLRAAANYEIDTSAPLDAVVATILHIAQSE